MVQNISSLIHRNFFAKRLNFLDVGHDTSIQVKFVVVKEKWVLSFVSKPLGLWIVPPLQVVILIVKVCWFEVVASLFVPHGM